MKQRQEASDPSNHPLSSTQSRCYGRNLLLCAAMRAKDFSGIAARMSLFLWGLEQFETPTLPRRLVQIWHRIAHSFVVQRFVPCHLGFIIVTKLWFHFRISATVISYHYRLHLELTRSFSATLVMHFHDTKLSILSTSRWRALIIITQQQHIFPLIL